MAALWGAPMQLVNYAVADGDPVLRRRQQLELPVGGGRDEWLQGSAVDNLTMQPPLRRRLWTGCQAVAAFPSVLPQQCDNDSGPRPSPYLHQCSHSQWHDGGGALAQPGHPRRNASGSAIARCKRWNGDR